MTDRYWIKEHKLGFPASDFAWIEVPKEEWDLKCKETGMACWGFTICRGTDSLTSGMITMDGNPPDPNIPDVH